MLTIYENGQDQSGHSGQARKHWCPHVPTHPCRVGTTRDNRQVRGAENPILRTART